MERLYKKVDPSCRQNCDFKRPLELIHPLARVYIHLNGLGPDTLQFNSLTGKYEKRNYWLFNAVALLRTHDGDYNVNGRAYPSVQFWDPEYKAHYQDLLVDFATELKNYAEIYPYVSFVRAQLNAFNAESGAPEDGRCEAFATTEACVDYGYNYENYDPETRYNAGLTKEYYVDTKNQQHYYYREANDYHEWVAKTYFDIFKNDPAGKLRAEIVLKPFPADEHFTPPPVEEGFLYKMIYEYGVWFYKTNMIATGRNQDDGLTKFIHDKKITRGYTEPASTYDVQVHPANLPFPVTLTVASPSPNLTLTLTPTLITSGTIATLTAVDHHPGPTLLPGLWYTLPITGTGGNFTSTTKVDLLVGGARTYLPAILRSYSPLNSIIR